MSGEQRQLQASIDAATKALAVLIEAAKDKVRDAGVSPSSAFVLSRRAEVSAEHPERLPAQHISIKASAAKLIGTPEAVNPSNSTPFAFTADCCIIILGAGMGILAVALRLLKAE